MKRNNDDIFDDVLDKYLDAAAEKMVMRDGEALEEPKEPHVFSKTHEKKMRLFITKQRRAAFLGSVGKTLPRTACVLLAVCLLGGAVVFSVDALQMRLLNYFFDKNEKNTQIAEDGSAYSDDDISFNYIPIGYELYEKKNNAKNGILYIAFTEAGEDSQERYFSFMKSRSSADLYIDTEDASAKEMTIQGYDAFYSENENVHLLVWTDGEYRFKISSGMSLSENEIIKIAENIVF